MSAASECRAVLHPVRNGATGRRADATFNSKEFIEKASNFTILDDPAPTIAHLITCTIRRAACLCSLPPDFPSFNLFLKLAQLGCCSRLLESTSVLFQACKAFPSDLCCSSFSESPAWTEVYFHLLDTPGSSWHPCQLRLLFLTFATHTSQSTTPQASERKSKNLKNSGLGAAQLVK